MRTISYGVLRQIKKLAQGLFQNRAVILIYHRIADHCPDPQLLCVNPSRFAEHLDYLSRHFKVISLEDLRLAIVESELNRKSVVVTFDDGYVDNLWNAKPLLERYEIPATVFVSSGYVGRDRELVSDELERIILRSENLPEVINVEIAGESYSWKIGKTPAKNISWNATAGCYPTPRHRCYHDLHRLLLTLDVYERNEIFNYLAEIVGLNLISARADYRVLNPEEMRLLAEDGLVEIGAHGVNHVNLANQSIDVKWEEIIGCKTQLEDILNRPVKSFSYPYGGLDNKDEMTTMLLQKAGFHIACANVPASVNKGSGLFWLPRNLVRDWRIDDFAKQVRGAFFD